jgi:hypothetical protein
VILCVKEPKISNAAAIFGRVPMRPCFGPRHG